MTSSPTPATPTPLTSLHIGDALTVLPTISAASIDAVVTDPPYAIKRIPRKLFEGAPVRESTCDVADCTSDGPCPECVRAELVAKFDSAAMLGQQSQNWHAKETHSRGYADNDPVQFQQWCSLWLTECLRVLKPGGHLIAFGGTRTWHRLATSVEDAGFEIRDSLAWLYATGMPKSHNVERALKASGHTAAAPAWSGWGTALRPAFEPIVLARKPLDGTMVQNVTQWAIGPINLRGLTQRENAGGTGRWPGNVHLDETTAAH